MHCSTIVPHWFEFWFSIRIESSKMLSVLVLYCILVTVCIMCTCEHWSRVESFTLYHARGTGIEEVVTRAGTPGVSQTHSSAGVCIALFRRSKGSNLPHWWTHWFPPTNFHTGDIQLKGFARSHREEKLITSCSMPILFESNLWTLLFQRIWVCAALTVEGCHGFESQLTETMKTLHRNTRGTDICVLINYTSHATIHSATTCSWTLHWIC